LGVTTPFPPEEYREDFDSITIGDPFLKPQRRRKGRGDKEKTNL
jgi:hypothetical protein